MPDDPKNTAALDNSQRKVGITKEERDKLKAEWTTKLQEEMAKGNLDLNAENFKHKDVMKWTKTKSEPLVSSAGANLSYGGSSLGKGTKLSRRPSRVATKKTDSRR